MDAATQAIPTAAAADPFPPSADAAANAALVVSAYVSANQVPADDLPGLCARVLTVFAGAAAAAAAEPEAEAEAPPAPAVPVERSVTADYLVCLEDGRVFKSLKRHLMTHYNLTPEQYREKWSLPVDYPMVAPNYAARRSALAKASGLGRKPSAGADLAAAA